MGVMGRGENGVGGMWIRCVKRRRRIVRVKGSGGFF